MRCKILLSFIFVVLFINLISATFIYSDKGSSINDQYGTLDYLKARINISFQNQSLDSVLSDSLGSSITIEELLELSPGYDYVFNDTTNTSINSAFHVLQLDQIGFIMPSTPGNLTYSLNLSGKQLFKVKFKIISIETTIKDDIAKQYRKLNYSKNEINKYDLFVQNILNEYLNLTSIEADLKKIEANYKIAYTNSEYNEIIEDLSNLIIPEEISKISETNSVSYFPTREEINLDLLSKIGEGEYSEDEQTGYIDALYFWNQENLKTNVSSKKILVTYGKEDAFSLSIFQFNFDKTNLEDEAYFIIENLENLKIEENYSQILDEESGYIYINLKDVQDKLTFSTTEDVNFITLPAFISPALIYLEPVRIEPIPPASSGKSKWILFGIIIFIVLLLATIIYFIIQSWYKTKYELSLFKNRNNLYNIMTFIQTAKKKGVDDNEIRKNLKKADWTGEQINYALRKYEGKKILGLREKSLDKNTQ